MQSKRWMSDERLQIDDGLEKKRTQVGTEEDAERLLFCSKSSIGDRLAATTAAEVGRRTASQDTYRGG